MDTTQVPAGYKVTELGVLPEKWEVKRLAEIASIGSGGTPNRKVADYWGGKIPWVTTAQIDFNVVENAEQFITDSGLKNSSAKLFKKGALLMAMYGQGKTRGKVAMLGFDATTNQACAVITLKEAVLSSYVLYNLTGRYEELRELSNSGGQENLSSGIIKSFLIPLPPFAEQQAIATALGEMDALLTAQRARLAKQRAVKQGLLQGLLSGEKRLPGFAGEWEVKRLGELFTILPTASNSRADLEPEGEVAYLHYGDIHTKYHLFLDCATAQLPYLKRSKVNRKATALRNGDLVMADASEDYEGIGKSVEIAGISDKKVVAGLHTMLLRATSSLTVEGYRGYMLLYPATRQHLQNMATGVSVYGITKANLQNTPVFLPPADEQRAIADVLSEADAHLAALEAEHAKTQLLKQGMMQNLLTGKIRLV